MGVSVGWQGSSGVSEASRRVRFASLRSLWGEADLSLSLRIRCRGEDDVESDVDVLVVAEGLPEDAGLRTRETNWIHLKLRETEAYRLLRASGRNCLISDVFFTPEEVERHPPVLLDMVEDGVILYDKNGFLRNVLEGLSEKLRRMGARRIKAGKGRYWILKPGAEPPEVVEI
ncbi:MAG: nucleotidyltransferase domain-containing protein [Candidatus Freyarchaeota archaeon]